MSSKRNERDGKGGRCYSSRTKNCRVRALREQGRGGGGLANEKEEVEVAGCLVIVRACGVVCVCGNQTGAQEERG